MKKAIAPQDYGRGAAARRPTVAGLLERKRPREQSLINRSTFTLCLLFSVPGWWLLWLAITEDGTWPYLVLYICGGAALLIVLGWLDEKREIAARGRRMRQEDAIRRAAGPED